MFDHAPIELGSDPVKSLVFESRRPIMNKYMFRQFPIASAGRDELSQLPDTENC